MYTIPSSEPACSSVDAQSQRSGTSRERNRPVHLAMASQTLEDLALRISLPAQFPNNSSSNTHGGTSPLPSTPNPSLLLTLPLELRLQILTHVVALHTATRTNVSSLVGGSFFGILRCDLNILLACRQLHDETRLLPFTSNTFAFSLWFGSSVFAAIRFLQALAPFQIAALRSMRLKLTSADLGDLGRVDELCALIMGGLPERERMAAGMVEVTDMGMRSLGEDRVGRNGEGEGGSLQRLELVLDDSGAIVDPYQQYTKDLFDVEEKWIQCGLTRLQSLKELRIRMATEFSLHGDLAFFRKHVVEIMPWLYMVDVGVFDRTAEDNDKERGLDIGWKSPNWLRFVPDLHF